MPQYKPSDDGKVVEGRVVVYMTGAAQSKALVVRSALVRCPCASRYISR
jgi:hypothetical protein